MVHRVLHKQELREESKPTITRVGSFWECTASLVLHNQDHNAISTSEHTTVVNTLAGNIIQVLPEANPDLLVVSPAIDGRLKDESKESNGE